MRRVVVAYVLGTLAVSCPVAHATLLNFGSAVPGTLQDGGGTGTGFTDRLPGTGAALPASDPNLDITTNPGILRFTSTQGDPNSGGINVGQIEAPGLLLNGVLGKNITLRTLITNVNVPNPNDQFSIYAGTSVSKFIRGGVHELETYPIAANDGGFDALVFDAGHHSFAPGDDILLTLTRTSGLWRLGWQNLTNPSDEGSSPGLSFPWLDSEDSLYVGIFAANAGSPTSQTYQVQFFEARVVPEPTTTMLATCGLISVLVSRAWRRRSARGPTTWFGSGDL